MPTSGLGLLWGGREVNGVRKGCFCIYKVLFIQKKDLEKIWQNIYVTAGLGGVDITKYF